MRYVLFAGVVIVAVLVIALHYIPIGIEPLSEVYFENHTKLPVYIFLNRTYAFEFTVHNLEYRDMNYSYDMGIEYGNRSGVVDSGEFYLRNNETSHFSKKFAFIEHFDRAKIEIVVKKDNNETIDIHFWVDEIKPLQITIEKENKTSNNTINKTN